MNGIIIVNQEIGHNRYKIDRFIEEFKKKDISLEVFLNDGTLSSIEDGNIVIHAPKADFVLYLDKDIYLARQLEKAGYRLFNKADFIKLCDDKVLTFIACANKGIRMPKTYAGPLMYRDLEEDNYKFLDKVINNGQLRTIEDRTSISVLSIRQDTIKYSLYSVAETRHNVKIFLNYSKLIWRSCYEKRKQDKNNTV